MGYTLFLSISLTHTPGNVISTTTTIKAGTEDLWTVLKRKLILPKSESLSSSISTGLQHVEDESSTRRHTDNTMYSSITTRAQKRGRAG